MIETIDVVHRANFQDAAGDLIPICFSVSFNDEALVLLADPQDVDLAFGFDEQVGWARFAHSRSSRQYDATVIIHDGFSHRVVNVPNVGVAHPRLQMFPSGEILLVGARCRRYADGTAENNAFVYRPDGEVSRSFVLGDGIQDVLISRDGSIWVSYFDEGIYGNKGWGSLHPGSHYVRPIGSSGLVRFDDQGRKLWEFSPPAGIPGMDDCYALNVTDDAAWAYYYAEFSLARASIQGDVRAWQTATSGAVAFAVNDDMVLLCGGYEPDESRIVLGRLAENSVENIRECRLSSPLGGYSFGKRFGPVGRGPIVHLFADHQWYQVHLRTVQ